MARIPPIVHSAVPALLGQGTETMSILFQVMAHRPELARQSLQLVETAMRTGTVQPKLKELVAVRVSQVNHCLY